MTLTPHPACSRCEEPLSHEERGGPSLDSDGSLLCDDCYRELYQFTCCWCENYDHVDRQHVLLVVFDSDLEVPPGVYRIVARPYYTRAAIGAGWLHPDRLERRGALPAGLTEKGYPCGHLCQECQEKIKEALPA